MSSLYHYDIIVVGGGHAGCEAANAAALMGKRVLLATLDLTKIAFMSCNPAIGGIAKGQIVREIDALGGYMGIATDKSLVQFRMLNKSKGPAMWSPRAQCDRLKYTKEWRIHLESVNNIDLWQDEIKELIIDNGSARGVNTRSGLTFYSDIVILTTGTFLNGVIHIGQTKISSGRASELAVKGLTEQFSKYGIESSKLKTGTSPRLDGKTIDFTVMTRQYGDEAPGKFSYIDSIFCLKEQLSCYITYTNKDVHDILRTGFSESPLYTGRIKGTGPRYCPSIEDKIVTFPNKDKHQLFVEPEGYNTVEYYLNGFTSSLPVDIQIKALRKINGLNNVKVLSPGYAIEYDYFQPTQLRHTLEVKNIHNLYFAGQINGTTGYEEAAAQGLIAGINAVMKLNGDNELLLNRDQAYIGVLIDDLVTKGVDEPYRMFTSRAEYRILLRQDNADSRLTEIGKRIGLVTEERYTRNWKKQEQINKIIRFIKEKSANPSDINGLLENKNTSKINQKVKLESILLRPQIQLSDLKSIYPELKKLTEPKSYLNHEIEQTAEIEIKYSGYMEREKEMAKKMSNLEKIKISESFDYNTINSLSTEARQKLNKIKPKTLGQASRISGVSPSDINVLLIHLNK